MTDDAPLAHADPFKQTLLERLRGQRADLLSKLDGLGEYDVRRPLTPTGTNLLGLVKHVASVQAEYLGEVFGRPSGIAMPWMDAEPDDDLWVPAEQSRAEIVALHHASAAHADATVAALPLDAAGEVPWWREGNRRVTLHQVLVHVSLETARHAGHADVLREGVDGAAGQRPGDANVTGRDAGQWTAHRERIEAAAREAARQAGEALAG